MKRCQFLTILILVSCSQQKVIQLITKTPKIQLNNLEVYKSETKYQKDAEYLVELIKQTYPRLYDKIPNFKQVSDSFKSKIKIINSDLEFDIEIKRYVAKLRDGHSNYSINFSSFDKNRFHFYVYKEKENWILGNVEKLVDSIAVGKKIKSINGISIIEIEKRILAFENGENKYWKFNNALYNFQYPKYWKVLNIIEENEPLKIILENKPKDIQIKIESKSIAKGYKIVKKRYKYPYRPKQNNGFYTKIDTVNNLGYLQMNTSLDYVSIKKDINNYTSFFTKPIALCFLKKKTKDAKDFGKTLQSFFKSIIKKDIKTLVIDLSYNTGGAEDTGKQLIWYLTENQNIKGFTEYINNTNYFQKQVKADFKKYNSIYKEKMGIDMPKGEINITEKVLNEKYFESISQAHSPYLLDKTIPKFIGKVYVITSPITFSAGQILATTLADNNLATIIGQPTGNKPSTQTGSSLFKLPHTKKVVSISYTYMERPDKDKNSMDALYPDVELWNLYDDFLNGEDKIMDYIISNEKYEMKK